MSREEVFAKMKVIITNHFTINGDEIVETLSIKDDLGADSISVMEFILEMEDTFGIEISDEDAEKIETVQGAVDYILANT